MSKGKKTLHAHVTKLQLAASWIGFTQNTAWQKSAQDFYHLKVQIVWELFWESDLGGGDAHCEYVNN